MRRRVDVLLLNEIDRLWTLRVLAIEAADVRDARKRNAHPDHQLSRRHVDPGDALSNRMLHLQTGVELQEGVLSGRRLEPKKSLTNV